MKRLMICTSLFMFIFLETIPAQTIKQDSLEQGEKILIDRARKGSRFVLGYEILEYNYILDKNIESNVIDSLYNHLPFEAPIYSSSYFKHIRNKLNKYRVNTYKFQYSMPHRPIDAEIDRLNKYMENYKYMGQSEYIKPSKYIEHIEYALVNDSTEYLLKLLFRASDTSNVYISMYIDLKNREVIDDIFNHKERYKLEYLIKAIDTIKVKTN